MRNPFTRMVNRAKRGQGMTEYIIIVALIAIAAIAAVTLFGKQIRILIGRAVDAIGGDATDVGTTDSAKGGIGKDVTIKNFDSKTGGEN